ncbi:MAG: FIST N-terminal domain-containing protein, partial [Acidimicrobiales bacterium]
MDGASPAVVNGTRARWMAVGHSDDHDARRAGAAAAKDAMAGADPRLLVVFCGDAYDLPALLEGINDVAGGVPVVGCSTAGEISGSGPGDAGVVIMG